MAQHTFGNQSDRQGYPGEIVYPLVEGNLIITRILGGATARTSTVEVDTTSTSFTITMTDPYGNKKVLSITGAGANVTDNAAAIATAIGEDIFPAAFCTATSAAAVVTITGTRDGESFSFDTSGDGNLDAEAVTQAAGDAANIPFGCVVVGTSGQEEDLCELPGASDDVVLGISVYDQTQMVGDDGKALYRGSDSPLVQVLESGAPIYGRFAAGQTPVRGDSLFWRYAGTGQRGELRTVTVPGETAAFTGWGVKGKPFEVFLGGATVTLCAVGRV